MKRTFVYTDEKSNKFWTIDVNNNACIITFGKVGTAGQTQTKEFANEEECRKAADKLIAEKTKKGYKEEGTEECTKNIDLEDNRITVNLENAFDLKRVLNMLINNIDQISELASPNDSLLYGKTVDGEFEPFEEDAAESEAIFFNRAAQYKELHKLIIQYTELVDPNQFVDSISDMRMGMNAIFALASQDEKYIPLFIEHHRKIRPGGGE